jgi:GDP-mannose 6-dehydrogenase
LRWPWKARWNAPRAAKPRLPREVTDVMRVSVFGLGYVGCVSAASFAADGHHVIGVDINPEKVRAVNEGRSPIVEPGLEELLNTGVKSKRLRATTSTAEAVLATDTSLICVGTPSRRNGSLDLTHLTRVCEQIGEAMRAKQGYHVVVVRSTVLPGTTQSVAIPALEAKSGKTYGEGFGVAVNPEFLREGSALEDFRHPPLTLVGHNHPADIGPAATLYDGLDAPIVSTSIRVAEMMKYTSNAWHAVKVAFANEIGNLCKRVGVDSHDVMDIFCRDQKLNLSPYYLKPGFAFGGSCLPKDLRALQYRAREVDLETPLINSVIGSNRLQVQHAIDQITDTGRKRIGLLGFSFKAGTDDLREAPMVILAEALLGKGYQLAIYDRNVSIARLVGTNKQYIEEQIPHLSRHLCESIDEVIEQSELLVVGNNSPEFAEALTRCRSDQIIIDLVRLPLDFNRVSARYEGICW